MHVCNLSICICAKYEKLTKNWAYAQHQIFFLHTCKMCAEYKYAECIHFAHMHSACMLRMCIVHIIITRFAHMLYICQLHASFKYALCFNDIIVNYVNRPNDFPFQNWPISVSYFNKFRLTANFYRFRCLLAIFHTKITLVLYDMGLFFNSTICAVTFDSRD